MKKDMKKITLVVDSRQLADLLKTGDSIILTNESKENAPTIKAESITIDNDKFRPLLQGVRTNEFTKVRSTKRNTKYIPLLERHVIKRNNLIIDVPKPLKPAGLRAPTYQLFDAVMVCLTKTGASTEPNFSPKVELSLAEYQKMRGLKSREKTRVQVQAALQILSNIKLSYRRYSRGLNGKDKLDEMSEMTLFPTVRITRKGIIEVWINAQYWALLQHCNIMLYPTILLRINNQKNPNSYAIGRKIAELKNLNFNKRNENIVSVKTLLENAPYIPSCDDDIKSRGSGITRNIIEPLERDLNAFKEIFTWEYVTKQNGVTSYKEFVNRKIKITWKNYPRVRMPKKDILEDSQKNN